MQVGRRESQVLRKGAVATADAQDGADVAVPAPRGVAGSTPLASHGDLAHDAAPDPGRIHGWRVLDDADELMPWNSREAGVAAHQLEVGPADTGRCHTDQAFVAGGRLRAVAERESAAGVENEGEHRNRLPCLRDNAIAGGP